MLRMVIAFLVVIIMLVTRGEPKDDLENIMKKMQKEMHRVNERLALNEEKLKNTQTELNQTQGELLKQKSENVQLKEDLMSTKEDLANTKEDLMDLINFKEAVKTKGLELKWEVPILKEPPFFHARGSDQDVSSITGQTISYDRLLYAPNQTLRVVIWIFLPGSSPAPTQGHTRSPGA
jgi:predicted nuclease with TOPRIM domain